MPGKRRYTRRRKKRKNKKLSISKLYWPETKMRLVLVDELVTVAGGTVSASVAMNTLSNCYNKNASTQVPLNEISCVQALWDLFRCDAVRITYTPKFNSFNEQGIVGSVANDASLYIAFDPDNNGVISDPNSLVTRTNTVRRQIGRPFKLYYKNPRNTFSSSVINYTQGGFKNLANENAYVNGIIAMTSASPINFADLNGNLQNVPADFPLGDIMVEMFCTFKGRQ